MPTADWLRRGLGVLFLGVVLTAGTGSAWAAGTIRIAFGDIATVETLNFLIAVERAKARGVTIETTYFKSEDIAAQAVVGGQADVGVGAPYTLLQKVKAPIRIFYQMSTLRFFPVVNTEFYQDWKDLDGQEVAVHARGSGTEAIMKLMAQRNGITYANVSYVPGAEVRTTALLQGHVKASIVDFDRHADPGAAGRRQVQGPADRERQRHRRGAVRQYGLPREGAGRGRHPGRGADQDLARDQREPRLVAEQRAKLNLLPDLPKDLEAEIEPFYKDAVANKLYPNNGGGEEAARSDFDFYTVSGALAGRPEDPQGRGLLGARAV